MDTYALDYETYYDKECSIRVLGPLAYFAHPLFDAYMVSVVGDNGFSFVGHPKDFDWERLNGATVISHNASFDETLYLYGVTQNWWPEVKPHAWYCTADMAAACGLPRSLKNAVAEAYGMEIAKTTRDNMSGKKWENMSEEFRKEVVEYALKDSELCLKLWQDYNGKWLESEKKISNLNRQIVQRGIPIDTELMSEQLNIIKQKLFDAEAAIPWAGEKPLLSRTAFDIECRKHGIEPPKSLAQTDAEAQEWIRINGAKYRWVEATANWRRINAIKSKIESFDSATMPDSRFYGGLMYFGSHTGRFSGSGGNLNLQNLPRDEMFGVNMRHLIRAPEGRKLVVVDLSQIEVRTLCWLAGDFDTMAEIAACDDIYEAFAIRFGLWNSSKGVLKDEDPKTRHLVKSIVLGCGYGAGANKFAMICDMPLQEAEKAVNLYRTRLDKIPKYWRDINTDLQGCYDLQIPYSIELPSGRKLNYGRLKIRKDAADGNRSQLHAIINRNGKRVPMKMWGGVLAENASQALARDIFSDMLLRLEDAAIYTIFHVHDEVVIECDESDAEEVLRKTIEIMSTPPTWIPDIALSAEGKILSHYKK